MNIQKNGSYKIRWLCGILVVGVILSIHIDTAQAASAESKFYAAERCAGDLQKDPGRQKYRDAWFKCINGFLAVYRHDPHGPWAAAGLYHAGRMYNELYGHSYLKSDKQEALDLLERVIKSYPSSGYKQRAQMLLAKIDDSRQMVKKENTDNEKNADSWYQKAQAKYQRLKQNVRLQKYRDQWLTCGSYYRKAYNANPQGKLAPAALFGLASSYKGLYKWSQRSGDLQEAERAFQKLATEFPTSPYGVQANAQLGIEIEAQPSEDADEIAAVIEDSWAGGDKTAPTENNDKIPSVVEGLRFWSNPRYTRVVIDANNNTEFSFHELREDPSIRKPQRIYIDVHNSRLSDSLQRVVPINDNLLSDARAGQYTPKTVRVVVDIKSAKTYKIFPLKNPFRIVLDVWGYNGDPPTILSPPLAGSETAEATFKLPPSALVKQLALGVRRVVIDPGHGGKDGGAPGYYKGINEKDVVLAISKRLAELVRSELNCEAILTRTADTTLSLEERTAIANTQNADLFISIHTNASRDKQAYGIETFILNLATDDEAIRVAAMENATSMKNISDLDSILKDLMQNVKVNESTRLAAYVQQAAFRRLDAKYDKIKNKGVKKAPFYVLFGADMPSILVETSFISNSRECKRLTSTAYQEMLCRGIIEGIKRYMDETNPLANRVINEDQVSYSSGG